MRKIRVCFRIEVPLYRDLREQARSMNITTSEAIRRLISLSYMLLFPKSRIRKTAILKFINEYEDEYIPIWEIVKLLVPHSANSIEEFLEKNIYQGGKA